MTHLLIQFSSKCVLLVVSVLQASDDQLQMTPHASLCAVCAGLQTMVTTCSTRKYISLWKAISWHIPPLQKLFRSLWDLTSTSESTKQMVFLKRMVPWEANEALKGPLWGVGLCWTHNTTTPQASTSRADSAQHKWMHPLQKVLI